MSYTVVWKPAAEEELARLWCEAADRDSLAAAANTLDRLLREAPRDQGESRSETIRVTFVRPLGVFYHIHEQDRLVSVLGV
jgi:plasmid stabilization system protein ParE